jgi:hypothetical protein
MNNEINVLEDFYNSNIELKRDINLILNLFSKPYKNKEESYYEYYLKDNTFKILNLFFYSDSNIENKRLLFLERKERIINIFNIFKDRGFNIKKLHEILGSINNFDFPLQIAFEFKDSSLIKIKVYLSNTDRSKKNIHLRTDLLKRLLCVLKIPDKIKNNQLLGEDIDCMGLDFTNDSNVNLKIYTYYGSNFTNENIKNTIIRQFEKYNVGLFDISTFFKITDIKKYKYWGFLYRINSEGHIGSIKCWFKFDDTKIFKIGDDNVSYIIYDDKGVGFYLR